MKRNNLGIKQTVQLVLIIGLFLSGSHEIIIM